MLIARYCLIPNWRVFLEGYYIILGLCYNKGMKNKLKFSENNPISYVLINSKQTRLIMWLYDSVDVLAGWINPVHQWCISGRIKTLRKRFDKLKG